VTSSDHRPARVSPSPTSMAANIRSARSLLRAAVMVLLDGDITGIRR
jgi:hypothetical protein